MGLNRSKFLGGSASLPSRLKRDVARRARKEALQLQPQEGGESPARRKRLAEGLLPPKSAATALLSGFTSAAGLPVLTQLDVPRQQPRIRRSNVDFSLGEGDNQSVVRLRLNPNQRRQVMKGFGAALTDATVTVLNRLAPEQKQKMLNVFFNPKTGLNFGLVRVTLGASDFNDGPTFTYADQRGPLGHELEHFTLGRDAEKIIPTLQEARKINPKLEVLLAPWQAPEWMTTRDAKGRRTLAKEHYEVYAQYLMKTVKAYEELDSPVYIKGLSIQNEPFNYVDNEHFPSMYWTTEAQREFIAKHLAPKLDALNSERRRQQLPETKVQLHDHNWDDSPAVRELLDGLKKDGALRSVDGVAMHAYGGDPSQYKQAVSGKYKGLPLMVTESSGNQHSFDPGSWGQRGDLGWDTIEFLMKAIAVGAQGALKWNLVLDENNGPINGAVGFMRGLTKIEAQPIDGRGPRVTEYEELHLLGMLSQAIQVGAQRINVGAPKGTYAQGFRNPDGSMVLLVHNPSSQAMDVDVSVGGHRRVQTKIAAKATATLVWPP